MSKVPKDYFDSGFFKHKYKELDDKLVWAPSYFRLEYYKTHFNDRISFSTYLKHSTMFLGLTTTQLAATCLFTYGMLFAFNYILPMLPTTNIFITLFILLPILVGLGRVAISGGMASFGTLIGLCLALPCPMLTGAIGITNLANNTIDFFYAESCIINNA